MTDNWIEWDGGERPTDEYVDIRFRDGHEEIDTEAKLWEWGYDDDPDDNDIVAYRISDKD